MSRAFEVLAPEHTVVLGGRGAQLPNGQKRRLRKPADGTLRTEVGKTGVGQFNLLPYQSKSAATVPRSPARPGTNRVARRTHEAIVEALAQTLMPNGCELRYDPAREDLVAIWPDRVVLFEVKTDIRATHLERGLGQLMMYGYEVAEAYPRRAFERVLVVPCRPVGPSGRAYRSACVYIMTFRRVANDEFAFAEDPDLATPIFTHSWNRSKQTRARNSRK